MVQITLQRGLIWSCKVWFYVSAVIYISVMKLSASLFTWLIDFLLPKLAVNCDTMQDRLLCSHQEFLMCQHKMYKWRPIRKLYHHHTYRFGRIFAFRPCIADFHGSRELWETTKSIYIQYITLFGQKNILGLVLLCIDLFRKEITGDS